MGGLVVAAAIVLFVFLALFQVFRREADVVYPFTWLSLIAICGLLALVGIALKARRAPFHDVWREFRDLPLNDRVQVVTSIATATVIICGIVFAAARYDQTRFADQLDRDDVTGRVSHALLQSERFARRAAREIGAKLEEDRGGLSLAGSPFAEEFAARPELIAFYEAMSQAQRCLDRQTCHPKEVRRAMCDVTEGLATLFKHLPTGRAPYVFEGEEIYAFVEFAGQSAIGHCSLPQALHLL